MPANFPDYLYGAWKPQPNAENQKLNATLTIERDGNSAPSVWFLTTGSQGVSNAWFGRGQFDGQRLVVKFDKVRGIGDLSGNVSLTVSGNTLVGAIPMYSKNQWVFVNGSPSSSPPPPAAVEVGIDASSALIRLVSSPTAMLPTTSGGLAAFRTSVFRVTGQVNLTGSSTSSAIGWELGFIQVQTQEINFAEYRGQTAPLGSVFIDRTAHKGKSDEYCRDTSSPAPAVWAKPSLNGHGKETLAKSATLFATLDDAVNEYSPLVESNHQLTLEHHKPYTNFLRRATKVFQFATVLSAKDPKGNFHHLCYIEWQVRWEATFTPAFNRTDGAGWQVAGHQSTDYSTIRPFNAASPIINARLLSQPNMECCNQRSQRVALASEMSGNRRFESRVSTTNWDPFKSF